MITVTQSAKQRVQDFLQNRGKGIGIRLSVQSTGCSGLGYNIEFVDKVNPDDKIFEFDKFKVVVDNKSLVYLNGTEIDFVKHGLNEGFEFSNPNAKAECGCGESFTV